MHTRRYLARRATVDPRVLVMTALVLVASDAQAQGSCASRDPLPALGLMTGAPDPDGERVDSTRWCAHGRVGYLGVEALGRWSGGAPDPRGVGGRVPGIGGEAHLRSGVEFSVARAGHQFLVRVAPELTATTNGAHATRPARDPARDAFSSAFYAGDFSADLPSRFGDDAHVRLTAGESVVRWTLRDFSVRATTARPAWGAAVGEGLVLGASAPGVPRVEARFARDAGGGTLAARWFAGEVRESDHFDDDRSNDRRGLSGARLEYVRERSLRLELGASRTVMDGRGGGIADAPLLPFASTRSDSLLELVSADIVARHAATGTTAWVEAVRQAPLEGLGAFLRFPTEGIAFRTGLIQRVAVRPGATWFATVEVARADQSASRSDRAPQDLYTSRSVVQGWTHRGQALGSGLGPGGQRQFLGIERRGATWRLSGSVERVRWNEDALFREQDPFSDRHDVTLQAGIAASRTLGGNEVTFALEAGRRHAYLFQGGSSTPDGLPVDVNVWRLGIMFRPAR